MDESSISRLEIAAMMLPVLFQTCYPDVAAKEALEYADALIKEEKKTTEEEENDA